MIICSQGLLDTKEKNQYMMGEKQYLVELEKNLKEQQVKERLDDVRIQYFWGWSGFTKEINESNECFVLKYEQL